MFPEENAKYVRRAYLAKHEQRKANNREYCKNNLDKFRVYNHRKRALRLNAVGSHSIEDVNDIKRLQRGRCAYSRVGFDRVTVHIDHIQPLSKGGTNGRRNLQLLCSPCNLTKNAKDPIIFAQSRGLLV